MSTVDDDNRPVGLTGLRDVTLEELARGIDPDDLGGRYLTAELEKFDWAKRRGWQPPAPTPAEPAPPTDDALRTCPDCRAYAQAATTTTPKRGTRLRWEDLGPIYGLTGEGLKAAWRTHERATGHRLGNPQTLRRRAILLDEAGG